MFGFVVYCKRNVSENGFDYIHHLHHRHDVSLFIKLWCMSRHIRCDNESLLMIQTTPNEIDRAGKSFCYRNPPEWSISFSNTIKTLNLKALYM